VGHPMWHSYPWAWPP